jgi:hypothetical protein
VGLAVTPARWTRRVSSSMQEQHIQAPQPHRVDGEAGRRRRSRRPARAGTPATWWSRAVVQGPTRGGGGSLDRGGRDAHPEPEQFALEALVAPAWVLGGQAHDQRLQVRIKWWTPVSARWVGPGAGDQAAMPSQQCLGGDKEAGPAGSWQRAADRGEQCPIGGFEPGSWGLAAQHGELVAEDQELEVLGGVPRGRAARAAGWIGTR